MSTPKPFSRTSTGNACSRCDLQSKPRIGQVRPSAPARPSVITCAQEVSVAATSNMKFLESRSSTSVWLFWHWKETTIQPQQSWLLMGASLSFTCWSLNLTSEWLKINWQQVDIIWLNNPIGGNCDLWWLWRLWRENTMKWAIKCWTAIDSSKQHQIRENGVALESKTNSTPEHSCMAL